MVRSVQMIIFLVSLLSTACGRGPLTRSGETDTNFGNYKLLSEKVGKADKVVLYEGLPHQRSERKLLAAELETKETVQHHGFPFYAEPVKLKEEDAEQLTKLFTDADSFEPFGGYKKCGGFHPDYCIEWHAGQEVYRCLVCFGCGEVKVFGPKTELYCVIVAEAGFKKVLQPYRKQRPKSQEE